MVDQLVIYTVILRQITLEKRYSNVTSQLSDLMKIEEKQRYLLAISNSCKALSLAAIRSVRSES